MGYTRDYAYCLGGFGSNPSYMSYYLLGGRPIGNFVDVMREDRCSAWREEYGIEANDEGEEDDDEDVVEGGNDEDEVDDEEGDEEEEVEVKLIDVVHKWSKKQLAVLLRSWKLHPRGSKKVLLTRVYKVLNLRPHLTHQGAIDLAAAKEAKAQG